MPLEWLIADNNRIESIEALQYIPTLQHVYVSNNQIRDIAVLEKLPKLKDVTVSGNPLDEQADEVLRRLRERGVTVNDMSHGTGAEAKPIRVILDANDVKFDVPPQLVSGSTLVQFRPVFERLGLSVAWDEETRTITGMKPDLTIRLQIDNPSAEVNGKQVALPVAPTIVNGSTLVPVRFIAESTGSEVKWDESYRAVIIRAKHTFVSADCKAQVTAYGLWKDVSGEFTDADTKLAIRSFNYRYFIIRIHPKAANETLDQYFTAVKQELSARTDIHLNGERTTEFQGHAAHELRFLQQGDLDDYAYTAYVFETKDAFYEVSCGAIFEYSKPAQEEDFDGMLKSLVVN